MTALDRIMRVAGVTPDGTITEDQAVALSAQMSDTEALLALAKVKVVVPGYSADGKPVKPYTYWREVSGVGAQNPSSPGSGRGFSAAPTRAPAASQSARENQAKSSRLGKTPSGSASRGSSRDYVSSLASDAQRAESADVGGARPDRPASPQAQTARRRANAAAMAHRVDTEPSTKTARTLADDTDRKADGLDDGDVEKAELREDAKVMREVGKRRDTERNAERTREPKGSSREIGDDTVSTVERFNQRGRDAPMPNRVRDEPIGAPKGPGRFNERPRATRTGSEMGDMFDDLANRRETRRETSNRTLPDPRGSARERKTLQQRGKEIGDARQAADAAGKPRDSFYENPPVKRRRAGDGNRATGAPSTRRRRSS